MADTGMLNQADHLLGLDSQLCFLLYSSSRKMTSMYRPLLEKLGLTYPQYLVMLVLWEQAQSRQETPVKLLGERLMLDTGTLTPLLKRMEQQGWLTRSRAAYDERVVLIKLTDSGSTLKAAAEDIPRMLLCQSNLASEDLLRLREQLRNLLKQLTP